MHSRTFLARRLSLLPLAMLGVGGCPDQTAVTDSDVDSQRGTLENDGYGPRPSATVLAGASNGTFRAISDELARHGTSAIVAGTSASSGGGATSGGVTALPTLERPAGTRAYMTGATPVGNIAETLLCQNVGTIPEAGKGEISLYTGSTGTNAPIYAQSSEVATSQNGSVPARQSDLPLAIGIGVQTFENGTVSGFTVPGFGIVPTALFEVGMPGESITVSDNLNFVEGFPLSFSTSVTVDQAVKTADGFYIVARISSEGSAGKMAFSVVGTHEFCIVDEPGKLRYASRTEYEGTIGVPTSSDASLFWNVSQTIVAHGVLD